MFDLSCHIKNLFISDNYVEYNSYTDFDLVASHMSQCVCQRHVQASWRKILLLIYHCTGSDCVP